MAIFRTESSDYARITEKKEPEVRISHFYVYIRGEKKWQRWYFSEGWIPNFKHYAFLKCSFLRPWRESKVCSCRGVIPAAAAD